MDLVVWFSVDWRYLIRKKIQHKLEWLSVTLELGRLDDNDGKHIGRFLDFCNVYV